MEDEKKTGIGPLRVDKALKSKLKKYLADRHGVTMENFCIEAIKEKLQREK